MLEIRTLTGTRLDIYPNATIEVNMGGISLLNLQDRTATYTNSFKLPRTPTNEAVFAFASQPTRNNRPSVDVIITKGLFQRQAVLKVLGFDKDYECSVSYSDTLNLIKDKTYEGLLNDYVVAGNITEEAFVRAACLGNLDILYLISNAKTIPHQDGGTGSLVLKISAIFDIIANTYGLVFSGDLITSGVLNQTYIALPDLYIFKQTQPISQYVAKIIDSGNLLTNLLREIAFIYFADIRFVGNVVYFNKIENILSNIGIRIDGFSFNKDIKDPYLSDNYIAYSLSEKFTNKLSYSDNFAGSGIGVKTAITLKSFLPYSLDGVVQITADENIAKIIICTDSPIIENVNISYKGIDYPFIFGEDDIYNMAFLALSGFYSSILNPIFANPVILEASRYIDPITADTIMQNRVITSVQLGGRYWVDTMAYNLTTGQSKLTLIKIP